MIELNNLKIFGSPWVPKHGHWGFLLNESQRLEKWAQIPEDTDVLITHGPPHGIGDLADSDVHLGCKHLLAKVKEVKPTSKPKQTCNYNSSLFASLYC